MAGKTKVVKSLCNLCPYGCGINVHVEEGKVVKITGRPEHPLSKGGICIKGVNMAEVAYSPGRLKYPQKKADGGWKQISWDEALDTIADKWLKAKQEFGAASSCLMLGDSAGLQGGIAFNRLLQRLMDVYGSPNLFNAGDLCYRTRLKAHQFTFGRGPASTGEFDELNLAVLWGHNITVSRPVAGGRFRNAVKAGMKLIVIDPRRIELAKIAEVYAAIRPGTDAALALGLMNVIISENLYDREFVDKWTVGFDRLVEHVKAYSPQAVEKITWIPAATIQQIGRMLGNIKPAAIIQGTCSLDQHRGGFYIARAIDVLLALIGCIGGPGARIASGLPFEKYTSLIFPEKQEKGKPPLGLDRFPLFREEFLLRGAQGGLIVDALLTGEPYPIKNLLIIGSNPVLNVPNSKKYVEAIKKLDFLAVSTLRMSETAELADIVMPAAHQLEKIGVYDMYGVVMPSANSLHVRQKITDYYEAWSDMKLAVELGKRLGYGEYFPWNNDEEVYDYALKPLGITVKQLAEAPEGIPYGGLYDYKNKGFLTPSGKVEIYSERLKELGYDPLPIHLEPEEGPVESPDLYKKYPLIMTTGRRELEFYHSQYHEVAKSQARQPEPFVEIHPNTARTYGIADGDTVIVENKRGSIDIKARVTEDAMQNVINLPHGWAQANCNVLTDDNPSDPVCGFPALKSALCGIRKKG